MSRAEDVLEKKLRTLTGRAIREAREGKGLSQGELADEAKLDRTYISMLENGRKNTSLFVFIRVCRALGQQPSVVLHGIEVSIR